MHRQFKLFYFLTILSLVCLMFITFETPVHADCEKQNVLDEIYQQQVKESHADELEESLPKDTRKSLDFIGVHGIDWTNLSNVTPEKIFKKIFSYIKESSPKPMKAAFGMVAIILLAALVDSFKISLSQRPLSGTVNVIATLCICTMSLEPIIDFIARASGIIKGASNFMLCYVPVMTGIMLASGQTVSATSYNVLMITAGEIISQVASRLITPLLSVFLALSTVSSISTSINLNGICKTFHSFIKWSLGFIMTIFVSLLTLQSLVGNSADSTALKATKFMISSFVPIVGGALGDALGSVQSCVKLLKSGVGAFGIIAASFIFLPIIIECLIWIATMNTCSAISEIFQLNKISTLLKGAGTVVSTMLSIILCSMMILTVSTVIVLIIGGSV